jgi:ferrochelatase
MDKYVIDVPFLLRALLVRGIILQTRPKKSAAAYAKNMVGRRSPLVVISRRMHEKVKQLVDVPVSCHALWKSFLTIWFTELHDKGVTEVMLFPLYPQHAMVSTTTILELAEEHRQKIFQE